MKIKWIIGLFVVGLLLFGWVELYYIPKSEAKFEQEQAEQLEPETHDFSKVLQYEHLYMGNAGNNINLLSNLPMTDIPRTFEQDPDTYRFQVDYERAVEEIGEVRVGTAILYNATAMFALIENMETIDFNFTDHSYTVTRGRVNDWFGEDVLTFKDGQTFEQKVQRPIVQKEQLAEWFTAYTERGI